MPDDPLLYALEPDGIAVVTLNREAKRNALNRATLTALEEAFARAEKEPTVRAILLTGAGTKAFSAGADIQEVAALSAVEAAALSRWGQSVLGRLEAMGKPSVAALSGDAFGGGLELAMACTVRISVPTARLGVPEGRLGIIPGWGGTQRLPRLVGRGRALNLLLTGELIPASEALSWGLVDFTSPPEALLEAGRAWLRRVLRLAPLAVAEMVRAVDVGLSAGVADGLAYESAAFGLVRATEDCQEGLTAFLEKREPSFRGE